MGTEFNDCGCCQSIKELTPVEIENPLGLSSLKYRIGTYSRFKASMHTSLSLERAIQKKLTTRADDDLAIAILDAWATVADILTFYQERIANEGFLRTATERMSILELARTIGYELRPGVAASTFLAFTLEDTPGAVEKTIIDIGTKVQSLPAQGQMPQIFETIEKIEARPECNKLKPRLTKTQTITNNTTKFFFKGINTRLKPGDGLLVVKYQSDNVVKYTSFNIISNIETDTILQQTHVDVLKQNLQSDESDAYKIDVFAFRIQTGLFGHNAPNWDTLPKSLKEDCFKDPWEGSEGEGISINVDSQGKLYGNGNLIYLDNSYLGILPNSWIVLQNIHGYHASYLISSTHERTTVDFLLSTKVTGLILDLENKFSFNWNNVLMSKTEIDRLKDFLKKNFHDDNNDGENSDNDLNWITDAQFEKIDNNKTIRITNTNGTNSLSIQLDDDITKATKATVKIKIGGKEKDLYEFIVRKESSINNNINNIFENDLSKFKRRVTTAYVQSELLQLAEVPIEEPVEGNNVTLALDLDHALPSLSVGQLISITGELVYTPGTGMTKRLTKNEVAIVSSIQPDPINSKYIKLIFTQDLDQKYKRDTVMLNANIARAIHGETKQEVLGSGDPSNREQQQFILKQKPLTFMSAPTASGTQSSLEIRVDNVLWKEVNNLYNLKPDDRAYIIRIDDNNQTRVIFGDNIKGASPSAGLENIEAKYKVGLGLSGMLKEDQLSVLASRPLGVRSVTNPIAPTGAADPEDRDHARQNAPLTVLTMERIVSLEDFENFAQAFAGIEKAQAAWLWNGKERIVHVTVASARGLPVNPTSILYNNLIKAINAAKDPVIPFKVDSFCQKLFNIEAKILVAADRQPEAVLLAVKSALLDKFSFESRQLGQSVTLIETIATIQQVKGVNAADVYHLYVSTEDNEDKKQNELIRSSMAYTDDNGNILPAELLIINSDGVTLTEMTAI